MDYSLYLNEFLVFSFAMFLALLSPGPDFAVVLKQSIKYGKRSSLFTSLGIGLGVSVHIIYTLLGIGFIISKSIILYSIVKYLGAIYLIYLGYQSLKSRGLVLKKDNCKEIEYMSDKKSFFIGFLCNALNPKATLFFISMFTVVIAIETPIEVKIFYGVFAMFAATLWFTILSLILSKDKVRKFFNSFAKVFDKLMGVILITLGISVAVSK